MRKLSLVIVLLFLGSVFTGHRSEAVAGLSVSEEAIVLRVSGDGFLVELPFLNAFEKPLVVNARVELVEPDDRVIARAETRSGPVVGRAAVSVPLKVSFPESGSNREFLQRLRLRFHLDSGADAPPVEGVVALSRIAHDFFELSLAAPEAVRPGQRIEIRVRAQNPFSGRPVSGVTVVGRMTPDGRPASDGSVTDALGQTSLFIRIPGDLKGREGSLSVEGVFGAFRETARLDVQVFPNFQPRMLSTDRPFYQPGQTAKLRLLAFGENRRALAKGAFRISITNDKQEVQFSTTAETSRFGIVGCEWAIPENQPLGEYRAVATREGETDNWNEAVVRFEVRRYELPTFSVTAQTDRAYYLDEQTPVVTIRGDFLHGAPVVGGSVRIVRFASGMVSDETDLGVGVTDEKGVCRVTLDSARVQGLFPKDEVFRDEHLAAFLTDPATGREEFRRFDLRLTRDEIHLYTQSDFTVSAGLPLRIPVRADRADGTPVECDVELFAVPTGRDIFTGKIQDSGMIPLGKVRTSRFGLAFIDRIAIPELDSEKGFGLLMKANAGNMRGLCRTTVTVSDEPALSITTDALLYPAARPVTVSVAANAAVAPDASVTVQLVTQAGVVASRTIRLTERRAGFSFQETAALRGPVTVFATLPFADASKEVVANRVILFPEEQKVLNAVATTGRDGYRPGDRASLALSLADERGSPVVGAFGVVIGDRAVGEYYRRETGQPFSPFGNAARLGFFPPRVEFAGVTLEDLRALDPARPLPLDLEPVAEWILRRAGPFASIRTSEVSSPDAAVDKASFLDAFEKAALPYRRALDEAYDTAGRVEFPHDSDSLRAVWAAAGLKAESLRDPWGQPYRLVFEYDFSSCVAFAESAGRDERFDTADDFRFRLVGRSFFLPVAMKLDQAAKAYQERAGEPIPDAATLVEELKRIGVDFDTLKDPWGRPYFIKMVSQFGETILSVRSYGPTGREETPYWNLGRPFFRSEAATIRRTLRAAFQKNGRFPTRMSELRDILAAEGVNPEILTSDRSLNVNARFSSFERRAERAEVVTGKRRSRKATVLFQPLIQTVEKIELFSEGYDRTPDTPDDFILETIHLVVAERPAGAPTEKPSLKLPLAPVEAGKGGIAGKVTDQTGAVIVAVKATARQVATGREFTAETDEYGVYRFPGLPSGTYHLSFVKNGFRTETLHDFEVPERMNIEADIALIFGLDWSDIVEINSSPGTLVVNSSNASVTTVVRELPVNGRNFSQVELLQKGPEELGRTPRVREYFPETLVWQPEIVTDARGRAKLPFTLADTVTTWRVGVIASTEDGRVALVERDLTAALPFFVDVDPPRTLTQGDEVAWPIVVRNELPEARNVAVRLAPTKGFEVIEGDARAVSVAAGASGAVTIPVRAVAPVIDGKPRVTIRAGRDADAVEKPITVRPDGMERTTEAGGFSSERFGLDSVIPANALPNSARMTLKIYPEFASHVFEGITGILERPHGCGEQTISSTYPNVLVLQYLKRIDQPDSSTRATALRYAAEGYERLRKYQEPDGGFSYWGDGHPDEALTAYALAFLADLAEFVPVDRTVMARAAAWLAQRQQSSGSWSGDLNRTAWIAKSLASIPEAGDASRRALALFVVKADAIEDAYTLAAFGVAASETGQTDLANRAAARLRKLARTANDGTIYWEAFGATPFNGWGRAGEIETTALVIRALRKTGEDDALIAKALTFLLANKDRYGVWYSTQATVLVQQTLMNEILRTEESGSRSISVTVDGRPVRTIALPSGPRQEGPIHLDLSAFAAPGSHRIVIDQSGERRFLSAQVVASWYAPWADAPPPPNGAPRLSVTFDRTECRVGEAIRCNVEVQRGTRFGMATAEIGLPPGAEVDRASLMGAAMTSRFQQFEIRPDRIVFYLNEWEPVARRTFVFRPRFRMKAKSIGSTTYDYYNPDALTTVAPVTFVVGARASSAQ